MQKSASENVRWHTKVSGSLSFAVRHENVKAMTINHSVVSLLFDQGGGFLHALSVNRALPPQK
jgi:hypothetical protein